MLLKVFKELDRKVAKKNQELREIGSREIPKFFIQVLGQSALIEAHLKLNILATIDVDAYSNFNDQAKTIFKLILAKHNLVFDELSSEIWMPQETQYLRIFEGDNLEAFIAQPEYVLLSKLMKAPQKNRILLVEYIAKGPSELFLSLCTQYKIDLKKFLDDFYARRNG